MKFGRQDYQSAIQDTQGIIGADEPVVMFRAKDRFMGPVLMFYMEQIMADAPDNEATRAMRQSLFDQANAVARWQELNGMKTPDLFGMASDDPASVGKGVYSPEDALPTYQCPSLNYLASQIGNWRRSKGFRTPMSIETEGARDMTLGKLMLVVSEVGEAAEAVRHEDFPNFAEELADTIIRVLDLTESMGIDIAAEIAKKMKTNEGRDMQHGKVSSL